MEFVLSVQLSTPPASARNPNRFRNQGRQHPLQLPLGEGESLRLTATGAETKVARIPSSTRSRVTRPRRGGEPPFARTGVGTWPGEHIETVGIGRKALGKLPNHRLRTPAPHTVTPSHPHNVYLAALRYSSRRALTSGSFSISVPLPNCRARSWVSRAFLASPLTK